MSQTEMINTSTFKALVVDDMDLARAALVADISTYCPSIEIVGEARGVVDGIKQIKNLKPDLVFLDIELGDGLAFDILDILSEYRMHVIFVTAKDEYALKAFDYAAIDYILKPVDPQKLVQAIDRLPYRSGLAKEQLDLIKSDNKDASKLKLVLNTSELIKVVTLKDIVRLESMVNYTQFYFADGSKLLITKTLKAYDHLLSGKNFLRVHQSHLVNIEHIGAYIKQDGGYLEMKNGDHVPVSVRKKTEVVEVLQNLEL